MKEKFMYQGKNAYKNSKEFRQQKSKIVNRVNEKYSKLLKQEKNFFKKAMLLIAKKKELRKELETIDPKNILFTQHEKF